MADTGGRFNTGERRKLDDTQRRLALLEQRQAELEREQATWRNNLRMAGYGAHTIRWLAVVGAAVIAIVGGIKGWWK